MKDKIIEKLEQHVTTLLAKDELTVCDVNFLVFWMNRLESKEAQESFKLNNELLKAERDKSNKAIKELIQNMFDGR